MRRARRAMQNTNRMIRDLSKTAMTPLELDGLPERYRLRPPFPCEAGFRLPSV